MMQKMGWCEGKGLGKGEDGMTQHIKLKKKDNNLGELLWLNAVILWLTRELLRRYRCGSRAA
jgi:hypothetical protein